MNEADADIDRAVQAQLDRLVAAELPDDERRTLLAWLDEDAARWRACALAFLEAQDWERSLADWPVGASAATNITRPQSGLAPSVAAPQKTSAGVSLRSFLAVAACVAVAFAAGALTARSWPAAPHALQPTEIVQRDTADSQQPAPSDAKSAAPLLATVQVRTTLDPRVPMRLQLPVTQGGEPVDRPPAMSDYVRSQWERRGFEVKEDVRYLPAQLPDGREIVVPINHLRLEYRGTPVL